MNLICIVSDTLRADYLGCYGNRWVKTPNIDRLAQESILFENAYAEGLPTLPARFELLTGKYTFPYRERAMFKSMPLETDITLAQILGKRDFSFQVPNLADCLRFSFVSCLTLIFLVGYM